VTLGQLNNALAWVRGPAPEAFQTSPFIQTPPAPGRSAPSLSQPHSPWWAPA